MTARVLASGGRAQAAIGAARIGLWILGIVLLDVFFYASTLEDSFITFRYAKHLAEGYGLGAWNITGDRVEGYSSLSWVVLLAIGHGLGFGLPTLSKLLGIASHAGISLTLAAFPALPKRAIGDWLLEHPGAFRSAGLLAAVHLPLIWYATTGMETAFFAALSAGFFVSIYLRGRPVLLPVLGALLILTRPEGLLICAAFLALAWLLEERAEDKKDLCVSAVLLLAVAALLTLQRLLWFDDYLPNTYWAKAGGTGLHHLWMGFRYVTGWAASHFALIGCGLFALASLLASAGLRERRAWSLYFVAGFAGVYALYVVKVGGDNPAAFPYWRHFVHISCFVLLLASCGLNLLAPRLRLACTVALALAGNAAILLLGHGPAPRDLLVLVRQYPKLTHAEPNPYFTWIRDLAPDRRTTIASGFGGELPFIVDAVHIDTLGLNTPYIAKHGRFDPRGPQDSKSDMAWVLAQEPDIIEGYFSAQKLIEGLPARDILLNWRTQMSVEMAASPIFQREYLFLVNGPYGHFDRALFLHRSYWENHPRRAELNCIPIRDTSIASSALEPALPGVAASPDAPVH